MLSDRDSAPIRVVLADDHALIREALTSLFAKQPDIQLVAAVDNGEDAVREVLTLVPDVAILDISMPKLNGIDAIQRIKASRPGVAILVLTVHEDYEHIRRVLEVGAAGYLTKDSLGQQVVHAVKATASGDVVLSQCVMRKVVSQPLEQTACPTTNSADLTARELQILRLAARGLGNSEIADELKLGMRTVRGHLEEVFSKLDVASRTEAVAVALRTGLLTLRDLG
jgi:DNA-binding NarL/FixJ family response regulator